MNGFLVFFLLVSSFAFNAFCMNPSTLGLPLPSSPENIQFGDCYYVHKIDGETLAATSYDYRYICPKKFPTDAPPDEKLWYFVGLAQEENLPQFHHVSFEQRLLKFVFLKDKMVELAFAIKNFEIKFQSFQQSQAFYAVIYNNVNLSQATPVKIGLLHQIRPHETKHRNMGNNVETLQETIGTMQHITFRNERGEPLLIFSRKYATILPPRFTQIDKPQLLLRVHTTFYILTFSNHAQATSFGNALLANVRLKPLYLSSTFGVIRNRFKENTITIDS